MATHSRLSNIFHNMKKRCYCANSKDFKNYGAKGITVCKEWLDSEKASIGNCTKGFIHFKEWALANGYSDMLTLDRIDVSKSYCPDNCRWVSIRAQENNKCTNLYVTYQGRTQSLADWCRELNLNYGKIFYRIHTAHWSVERAFESV